MTVMQLISCVCVCLCLAATMPRVGFGQERRPAELAGGPLTGPPTLDAPFSADATTTVRQSLGDGTRVERTATARYYRDRAGRVRVEQTISGREPLNPAAEREVRITIRPDPAHGAVYTLDPRTRTARQGPRHIAGLALGGGGTFALPLGGVRFLVFHRGQDLRGLGALGSDAVEGEPLGSRRIAGVEVTGRRATTTASDGRFGH